jgi:large subunit ribosomal protein L35
MPIGSRRRRVALRTTPNALPFEQLPFQAFQEARKILAADREAKLGAIRGEVAKMAALAARDASTVPGGERMRQVRLASLRRHVEHLKILADANDPLVRKRFEDGLADMAKPIYRHYAERKWRAYARKLLVQRIRQFHIVPDVLPKLEPELDAELFFRKTKVGPGDVVGSLVSESAPRLRVQAFDRGQRLLTVAVVDPDVPDVANDRFSKRCHFLAANVPVDPTTTSLPLGRIRADDQLAVPWLPAFAQKGAPYHRLAIVLLEQPHPTDKIDAAALRERFAASRDGFSVKALAQQFALRPVGFTMFRSVWDENTASVMARHGQPGADIELRPARVYSMKQPVKPRGWEAKRQGPKYRHLWKYTKRIRGISNARGWTKRR